MVDILCFNMFKDTTDALPSNEHPEVEGMESEDGGPISLRRDSGLADSGYAIKLAVHWIYILPFFKIIISAVAWTILSLARLNN